MKRLLSALFSVFGVAALLIVGIIIYKKIETEAYYNSDEPKIWEESFSAYDFTFDKTSKAKQFIAFANNHFPEGSSKAFVDKILHEIGGASKRERSIEAEKNGPGGIIVDSMITKSVENIGAVTFTSYGHASDFTALMGGGWSIYAFYDADDRLLTMFLNNDEIILKKTKGEN